MIVIITFDLYIDLRKLLINIFVSIVVIIHIIIIESIIIIIDLYLKHIM